MRILITLSLLILSNILFISCENSVAPLSPNDGSEITIPEEQIYSYGYVPILLPQRSQLFEDSVYTISQEINGTSGGRISYDNYYISSEGDSVIIDIDLFIPPNAFEGTKTITIKVDSVYAGLHFYPSMTFQKPLFLFNRFKGLDLTGMQTGTIDFVYTSNNGENELINKNGILINVPQGLLSVNNARLLHFSRYGWVRKTAAPIVIKAE